MSTVKIFSGSQTLYLSKKIAEAYGTKLGNVTVRRFSDGEILVRFESSIRGDDLFIIQSTFSPSENIVELLMMVDAAKRASAYTITVLLPYYGYARQDRKDQPRVSMGAKLIANLLQASGATRIVTCELHTDQIQGFFDIPVVHLESSAVFVNYVQSLGLNDFIFAAPDVGGVKRTRAYAKYFKTELVICDKHRERANEVASMEVIGDVKNHHVILVDDMVDTASTLCSAAEILMAKGAKSVRAICTHPILSGKAHDRVEESALEELVVTDTIPLRKKSSKIKVLTASTLFAKAIRKINDRESISGLFIQ